jgi:Glycogen recognition site of AMP-activated protein kinase
MDPSTVSRRIVRLEYEAIRLPFALFDDLVIARYCDQDAFIRLGFERFLGSMDVCAGRLLDDEVLAERGEALLRQTGCPASADAWETADAWEAAEPSETADPWKTAYTSKAADTWETAAPSETADASETADLPETANTWETAGPSETTDASETAEAPETAETWETAVPPDTADAGAPETAETLETAESLETIETPETAEAPETVEFLETADTSETAEAPGADSAVETAEAQETVEPLETADTSETAPPEADDTFETAEAPAPPAPAAGTVDITFTLPADVRADTVALCGDFNDWSAGTSMLERARDGSWQVTVALEPGRSYRYRYLLDGERWENAWQADRYVPNAYGGTDSVIVVD